MSCHFTLGSYTLSKAGPILPAPCAGEAERMMVTFQSRDSSGRPVCPTLFLGLQTHLPCIYSLTRALDVLVNVVLDGCPLVWDAFAQNGQIFA